MPSDRLVNVPDAGVAVAVLSDQVLATTGTLLNVKPLMVTARVSPASRVADPVIVGFLEFVVRLLTNGADGGVVSTTSSLLVASLVELPARSVTVAVTE